MVSKIKIFINSLNKTLVLMVALSIIGIFYAYFFLYFERQIINISSTYHPDSIYYLREYSSNAFLSINFSLYENITNLFKNILTNSFYSSIMNLINEIALIINDTKFNFLNDTLYRNLIKFNILFYLIGNIFIIKFYSNVFKEKVFDKKNLLLLTIILFLPYKTHLTINILKDSLILFLLIFAFTSRNIYSFILSIFLGTSFRWGFFLYLILFINKKILNKKLLIIISITVLAFLSWFLFTQMNIDYSEETSDNLWTSIKNYFTTRNNSVIGGRDFDQVYNFSEYKLGSIFRGIVWPFLFITGTFSIFTKSYLFYCLAIEIIVVQFLMYWFYKKFVFNLNLIIILILIAMQMNTFTAYFRYSYLAYYISLLITFLDSSNYRKNSTN